MLTQTERVIRVPYKNPSHPAFITNLAPPHNTKLHITTYTLSFISL